MTILCPFLDMRLADRSAAGSRPNRRHRNLQKSREVVKSGSGLDVQRCLLDLYHLPGLLSDQYRILNLQVHHLHIDPSPAGSEAAVWGRSATERTVAFRGAFSSISNPAHFRITYFSETVALISRTLARLPPARDPFSSSGASSASSSSSTSSPSDICCSLAILILRLAGSP